MRRLVLAGALAGLLAFPGTTSAAAVSGEVWSATLSGGAEVPAVATGGTGTAWFVLSPDGAAITYLVQYNGLSGPVAAAHIHLGAAGANGGVMLPLEAGPSPMVGTLRASDLVATGGVTTFAGAVDAIRAGNTYVNLHTTANPGGEVRGQLGAATGAQAFQTPLTGTQEVPPVAGSGSGEATVIVDAAADALTYIVTYAGLSSAPAAGHIHLGAPGANGGVMLPLANVGTSPVVGTLTAADLVPTGGVTTFAGAVDAIRDGNTYVNLHTTANPGGEVRGQLGVALTGPAPTAAPVAPATPGAPAPGTGGTLPPTDAAGPTSRPAGASPIVPMVALGVLAGIALGGMALHLFGDRRRARR